MTITPSWWSQTEILHKVETIGRGMKDLPSKPGGQKSITMENKENKEMINKEQGMVKAKGKATMKGKDKGNEKKQKSGVLKHHFQKSGVKAKAQAVPKSSQSHGTKSPSQECHKNGKGKKMDWKNVHSRAYHSHMVRARAARMSADEAKASFKQKLPVLKKAFREGRL